MAYISFNSGFKIGSRSAIDERILLTKAQMKTAHEKYMLPNQYFCVCLDDGKFYLYSADNELDAELGKYRPLEDTIDFKSEEFKKNFEDAIEASEKIKEVNKEIEEVNEAVEELEGSIVTIQGDVTNIKADVTELEEKVGDTESGLIKEVKDLEPKVNALSESVDDLEPRVQKAQEDIIDIQAILDDLKADGGEIVDDNELDGGEITD